MQSVINNLKTHGLAILAGILVVCAFFLPVYQGKVLQQNDVTQAAAMQHEMTVHKEKTGEQALWTNNLFSGMPTFMVGVSYNNPVIGHLLVPFETFFKSPSSYAVYYFLGFYLLLIVMGCNPWISAIGAVLFALSSYNIIILEAGHNTKARCIGFIPFILAGLILLFKRKYAIGTLLCGLFLFFQIKSNHPQIIYYMFIMLGFYFIYQLVEAVMTKQLKTFFVASSAFTVAVTLAVAANFAQLWVTYEYTKDTMRGGSELVSGNSNSKKNEKGLDISYAFMWSYGKMESFTFLIPDLFGGSSSGGKLDDGSKVYKEAVNAGIPESNAADFARSMPTYWGPKTFHNASTSGPVYFGAIVCFLFLLGVFLIKDKWRWWLYATTALTIIMAWGSNFMAINAFLFNYLPMYNKFRTPEMVLAITQFTVAVIAILTLKKITDEEISKDELLRKLKISSIILGAVLLFFALMPSVFLNFISGEDDALKGQLIDNFTRGGGTADMARNVVEKIMSALKLDREHLAMMDAWRSLIFILIAAGALWAFAKNKLKKNLLIAIIGVASLIDLWSLDRRYVRDENFKEEVEQDANFQPSLADAEILKDPSISYRVYYSPNPYNEATPSYFHKNVGGYSPAKLARYQDLIDSCLGRGNMQAFDMLNTKYFIVKGQNGQEIPQQNQQALGNAWMVDSVQWVNSPREEIMAIKNFNPKTTALIDASKFKTDVSKTIFERDSTSKIVLIKNDLNTLEYNFQSAKEQLVVFSEIYYADKKGKGWQAYVDGKPTDHFRVNYILRGMILPAGNHHIEFKFEPRAYITGQKIANIGSWLLTGLMLAAIVLWWMEQRKIKPISESEKLVTNKKKK